MANGVKIIGLLAAMLVSLPMAAKKPVQKEAQAVLSVERQQQFTYYWYAAKQAIRQERYPDALVLLQFCEQLNPADGETQELLGILYDALGDSERAFAAYEKAFNNDPHDQWLRYTNALLNAPTKDKQHQALQVMEQAHHVNPKDEELLDKLRQLYAYAGEFKKSLAVQDEIDAIRGYDAYSAYNRTSIYALWGKPKKAIAEVDRWLENEPTNVQFLLYRIDLLQRAGARQKELYDTYERVIALAPRNLMVLNNYAYLLATHGGDLRKAEQLSQITIHDEPNNPVYLDTYGWIMHLQGQEQLAQFYLNKALWNATDDVRAEIVEHLRKVKGNHEQK